MFFYVRHALTILRHYRVMHHCVRHIEKQHGSAEWAFRSTKHVREIIIREFRGIEPEVQFFALMCIADTVAYEATRGANGESSAAP